MGERCTQPSMGREWEDDCEDEWMCTRLGKGMNDDDGGGLNSCNVVA